MTKLDLKNAHYIYCLANGDSLPCLATVEQLDDLYTSFISGVIDSTGQRIGELSPIPEPKTEKELLERWIALHAEIIHNGIMPGFTTENFLQKYPTEKEWNHDMINDLVTTHSEDLLLGPQTIEQYKSWFFSLRERRKNEMLDKNS